MTLIKARMGAIETWLRHVESRSYEVGFEDCRLLVIQILPKTSMLALGPYDDVGYTIFVYKPSEPGMRARKLRFLSTVTFYFFFFSL